MFNNKLNKCLIINNIMYNNKQLNNVEIINY